VREVIARDGNPDDFIGHIAGDDFVFVTTLDKVDRICQAICTTFDRLVPLYYHKVDRERGYSYAQLATAAAEAKQRAKAIPGSSYVRDARVVLPSQAA
jgi:hypothetical protein